MTTCHILGAELGVGVKRDPSQVFCALPRMRGLGERREGPKALSAMAKGTVPLRSLTLGSFQEGKVNAGRAFTKHSSLWGQPVTGGPVGHQTFALPSDAGASRSHSRGGICF